MANVVFDEQSAARIAKAVKYVEGLQSDEPPVDDDDDLTGGRTVISGTFSGIWAKGATAAVSFTADNGSTGTKDAINNVGSVGAENTDSGCVIQLVGSQWTLVNADPSVTCSQVVSDVSLSGTLTVVTGVACVDGNLSVTTEDISLADFLTVTSQNISVPLQGGCS